MPRSLVVLTLALAAMIAPSARATVAVAGAGSAQFGVSACLQLGGIGSPDAGRQRATGIYTPSGTTKNDAGFCLESDPHVDLTIHCVDGAGSVLFAAARGHDGKSYLLRIEDSPAGDRAGVLQATSPPGSPRCGAEAVPTEPVGAGGFAVVAA